MVTGSREEEVRPFRLLASVPRKLRDGGWGGMTGRPIARGSIPRQSGGKGKQWSGSFCLQFLSTALTQ